MAIDFRLDDLGWFEFEQLVQSLTKARLGMGVEAWGGRGDWGRDAYFAGRLRYPTTQETDGPFIFQCKFVESANAAGAKPGKSVLAAVNRECGRIRQNLESGKWSRPPNCYGLFTNAPLTPSLRASVRALLGGVLPRAHAAIHDGPDICQWLRLSPEIVRTFPQLLSLRDLRDLLRDAVHSDIIVRSQTAIALAQAHARIFVPTKAYDSARAKLVEHGFVVLEGPPEMGKTTIGRIIALSQIVCGWEGVECRSPTDVLKMYRHSHGQVFVADDFFGRTEYEPMRVSEWQSELVHILPLLNRNHWLILTCRAHLLEMAKVNLDIAGQNHRFPDLGQVVVNAGDLTPSEKARILYRHAKAVGLTHSAKGIVKRHAAMIVNHKHFTPERIRRLIEELASESAIEENLMEGELKIRLSEALSDPTRQMRVSFRKLPACHRWMMFALLETDRNRIFGGIGRFELQARYDALCPPDIHRPSKRVLDELTEAFITKSKWLSTEQIDWIHPSCRDLAIDELSEQAHDRQQFLSHCSEAGIALATSLAGGANGQRQLPLLQVEGDWAHFTSRVKHLIQEKPSTLRTIWGNYEALKKQADHEATVRDAVVRLASAIREGVSGLSAKELGQLGYSDSHLLETLIEICRELQITPDIDFGEAWADCFEEVKDWVDSQLVIWQDTGVPGRVASFLSILNKYQPSFFAKSGTREQLNDILATVLERAATEDNSSYDSPRDADEIAERAEGFENLHKCFEELAIVPVWLEDQRQSLKRCSVHFQAEAESLLEDLPSEPDYDDERRERPASDDVPIDELFRDL